MNGPDDIIHTEGSDLRPLQSGHVRINVPALFKFTFGRDAHPVADHAKLVLFTNRIADFMNGQAYRWRHRLMTSKFLQELANLIKNEAQRLRDAERI